MKFPGYLRRHTVTVTPYLGSSAYGPRYGPVASVTGLLERRIRVVRDKDGNEVTATATFRTDLDHEGAFPAESLVTLDDGRKTTVITSAPHNGGGLPVPDHLEVQIA